MCAIPEFKGIHEKGEAAAHILHCFLPIWNIQRPFFYELIYLYQICFIDSKLFFKNQNDPKGALGMLNDL